uniref:SEFIR domain-containing protein n=1 Tax=Poecilia latipinna TaxID=48699 RepID=A0A3B3V550_9TELE
IMWQCILFGKHYFVTEISMNVLHDYCELHCVLGPPITDLKGSPSKVADLTLELLTVGNERKLNVSWAINIDASNRYLKYTRIISGLTNHICIYNPPFTAANLTGLEKVQTTINAPFRLLSPDKRFLSYSGFEILPMAAMTPVSVVVVYPPVTPAFQQAVVALAEFLQWHGGCRVAIDMWQQGKIAGLGPLRWLTEQVKSADHVLIVSPQPSSMSGPCTPASSLPRHSIPAATGDLYPLILNMVAGHARSATELAKFWVVQLHAEKDKNSCVLPPELQTCRAFCLMKDLNRLCKSLHSQRKVGKKISSLLFKHKILYSQNSTMKLREAIEMLGAKKPDVPE